MTKLADLPQGEHCFFDEYSSDKWDWAAIKVGTAANDLVSRLRLYKMRVQ